MKIDVFHFHFQALILFFNKIPTFNLNVKKQKGFKEKKSKKTPTKGEKETKGSKDINSNEEERGKTHYKNRTEATQIIQRSF